MSERAVVNADGTVSFAGHVLKVGERMPDKLERPAAVDYADGLLHCQGFVASRSAKGVMVFRGLVEYTMPKRDRSAVLAWIKGLPTATNVESPEAGSFEWMWNRLGYGMDLYYRQTRRPRARRDEATAPVLFGLKVGTSRENLDLATGIRYQHDPANPRRLEGLGRVARDGVDVEPRTRAWMLSRIVGGLKSAGSSKGGSAIRAAIRAGVFTQAEVDALDD